jgi:hypothetical protein
VRVHRWRWFRHQVSSTLVQLWTELHAGAPRQLQLPLGTIFETRGQVGKPKEGQYRRLESSQPNLALVKSLRNNSSDARSPSLVRTTDLALLAGSEIKPLACSRFRLSQSKPFQALTLSWRVK